MHHTQARQIELRQITLFMCLTPVCPTRHASTRSFADDLPHGGSGGTAPQTGTRISGNDTNTLCQGTEDRLSPTDFEIQGSRVGGFRRPLWRSPRMVLNREAGCSSARRPVRQRRSTAGRIAGPDAYRSPLPVEGTSTQPYDNPRPAQPRPQCWSGSRRCLSAQNQRGPGTECPREPIRG